MSLNCHLARDAADVVVSRRAQAAYYHRELSRHADHIMLLRIPAKADPSWFGFPITVEPHVESRVRVRWLEDSTIETRLVFGGNVLKQPAFRDITCCMPKADNVTDAIMVRTFVIGVYPGLVPAMRDNVVDRFDRFFAGEATDSP